MTGQVKGTQTEFALFQETVYGADPGSPAGDKMYATAFGLQMVRPLEGSETIGSDRGVERPIQGNKDVNGSIDMELSGQEIGTLLKHTLGSNADSGAGPYTHTITFGDLPVGLTLEKDHGSLVSGSGRYEKFNGCKIQSATFTFPASGFPSASFDFVGADSVYASAPLDASLTDNSHTSFSAFQATIEEGGSSIAIVTEASITVENDLDSDVFVLGGAGKRASLPEGFAKVSGSITAIFDPVGGLALLNKARAGTASSLKITLSRGDGLGSAGNESIEFLVQQLDYSAAGSPVTGPSGILITLPFQGYRSGSDLGMQIILKNAVAVV